MAHDPTTLRSRLDALTQIAPKSGGEYWSARDLWAPLGYAKWEGFEKIITRAIETRREAGLDCAFHFRVVMTPPGAGDFRLTRLACHLITMAADGRKKTIAAARTYFAPPEATPPTAQAPSRPAPAKQAAKPNPARFAVKPAAAPEVSVPKAESEATRAPIAPGKPVVNTGSRFIPQDGGRFYGSTHASRNSRWNPNCAVSRGYPNSAARTGR